jgi:alkylated DNA nucleotide flippase Atl1
MSAQIETTIFDLLAKVPAGKSISPEEVARVAEPERWRRLLGHVRTTAVGLALQNRLVITRHGKPADPEDFRGVYRLKLPEAGGAAAEEGAV